MRALWSFIFIAVAERFCINCPAETIESDLAGTVSFPRSPSDTEFVFAVSSQVSRVSWTPDAPFANELARLDRPAILTNTVASKWLASKWTPELLASRLENTTLLVKNTSDPTNTFYYCHHTPFSNSSFIKEYTSRCFAKHEVLGRDFFASLDGQRGPRAVASVLDAWGSEWWLEAFPIEPMIVTEEAEGYQPERNHLFRQTHVWVSSPNTTTPAHFDVSHNLFYQIYGRKQVLLAPPSAWEHLYLHPVLHPGHRSAQVNVSDPNLRAFPHFRPVDALEAVLEPGDVLYIPPLWFHHVTTLDTAAISLSVWSHYEGAQRLTKLLEQPLPLLQSWDEEKKWAALRLFLESVFDNLSLGMNVASFLHWTLLEHRYNGIETDLRDVERWCVVVEGSGTPAANQFYRDRSSGAKGTPPYFVGTTDSSYKLKFQKHWILGHSGEEKRNLYQGSGEAVNSLYGEYLEALGVSPPPIVRPCNDTVRYCFDEDLTEEVKMESFELLATRIKEAVSVFKAIQNSSKDEIARLHILLADYFEIVINSVVGPLEVRSFVHDFVHC